MDYFIEFGTLVGIALPQMMDGAGWQRMQIRKDSNYATKPLDEESHEKKVISALFV